MLPPCRKSLEQHIRRVNYQVGIGKRENLAKPIIPDACDGHGWQMTEDYLEPKWFEGQFMPQQLADAMDNDIQDDDDDIDDDDEFENAQFSLYDSDEIESEDKD